LLEGTEGNDTLSSGQDSDLAPATINLLEGADVAVVEDPLGITVSGGDGDDIISSTAVGNTLNGDAGNDRITGIDANNMHGGAGDDEITFNSDVELNSSTAQISGGAGNDTINVLADAGVNTADRGGAIISGGAGNDEFNITLVLENSQEDSGVLDTNIGRITDFDPAEDTLIIDVEKGAATVDREIALEFDQTEVDGAYTTVITMTFAATDSASEATATTTILSEDPFTVDDITLVETDTVTGQSDDSANWARDGNIAILEEFDAAIAAQGIDALELFVARHPGHDLVDQARIEIENRT
jgi:hypothetical protein